MDLSFIIVNWNSRDDILKCIASIFQSAPQMQFEVIVVDNNSIDNSCLAIQQSFPKAKVIQTGCNLGFAHANNVGFEQSLGRYLLFLNPDTEIVRNAVDLLYDRLQASPEFGLLGCQLLNSDYSVQTSAILRFPTIFGELLDSNWLRERFPCSRLWGTAPLWDNNPQKCVAVEAISGACILARREALERVGCFSTDYFMYSEDIDICYKVRAAGLQVGYWGEAKIIHHGGKSSVKQKEVCFSDVLQRESRFKFLRKTRGSWYAWSFRFAILFSSLARLFLLSLARVVPVRVSREKDIIRSQTKWKHLLLWTIGRNPISRRLSTRGEGL